MMHAMDEKTLIHQISTFVDEEHGLRTQLQAGKITEQEEHDRLRSLEEQLDQLWDLLRRRRAAKLQGVSPDEVELHSVDEVEHYLQ
jgi:vacuolar-type H+-ATPase subunit B/Vma2